MDRKTAIAHFAIPRPGIVLPGELPVTTLVHISDRLDSDQEAGHFLAEYVKQLERSVDTLTEERDLARAERNDVPRTITLTYMPRQPEPEKWDSDLSWDYGNHWTISEGGKHQDRLDPREALALVAAMLLGAKHPPLRTIQDSENHGHQRGRRAKARDAEEVVSEDFEPETRHA